MKCNGCGADNAIKMRIVYDEKENVSREICDHCGLRGSVGVPDVYFRSPYFDENLGDERNPNGQRIESKMHKAAIMRQLGVTEAGDKRHGARNWERNNYGERKKHG
jgi:hypothetical protein